MTNSANPWKRNQVLVRSRPGPDCPDLFQLSLPEIFNKSILCLENLILFYLIFQFCYTISARDSHSIWIDKYKLNIGGGKHRTFYTIFVVDYNWNTGRYYLIGQITAASNRITLIGVVSFSSKTYMTLLMPHDYYVDNKFTMYIMEMFLTNSLVSIYNL